MSGTNATLIPAGMLHTNPTMTLRMLHKTAIQTRLTFAEDLGVEPDKTIARAISTQAIAFELLAESRAANAKLRSYNYGRTMTEFAASDAPPAEAPLDETAAHQATVRALSARHQTAKRIADTALTEAGPAVQDLAQRVAVEADDEVGKQVSKLLKAIDKLDTSALERAVRIRSWSVTPTASLATARGADIDTATDALATLKATIESLS